MPSYMLYPAAVIAAFVYLLLVCRLAAIVRESLIALHSLVPHPVCWLTPDDALWLDDVFSDAYEELTCDD